MKCKHQNTRKLFWSNNKPHRWERTNVSICLDCEAIVGLQPAKMVIRSENIIKDKSHVKLLKKRKKKTEGKKDVSDNENIPRQTLNYKQK